jgi:L-2,4-diaminobutyric acid acetyltransferase
VKTDDVITFRKPDAEDGAAVWELVRECKPLDENSMYCNLLQAGHFRDTCVVAERRGEIVGWVSGYILPSDPGTVFVWQVAVSGAARGEGLGARLLEQLLRRDACRDVRRLQTTITRDNAASWALFRKLADRKGGALENSPEFTRDVHFQGRHATEHMVTITFPAEMRRAA